ncbi:MAG: 1,4-dihydroxy-2-naphthoate polyprenyltransferase [Proteobacteria bacterium]|nr:1,4-dihydroxy-2-naphthoate polyprenyltransferase [Pseudomonadota bacterium]
MSAERDAVAAESAPPRPGAVAAWWQAARPRTLPVAVAPVLVGVAAAVADGRARIGPASAALVAALLLQIGANFANDLFDFLKGADTEDRVGPPRATQSGWISSRQMAIGTGLAFGGAALVGVYLIAVGGWPILVVGVLSIAAGLAYTGGPWPLGYHGLGDAAVFCFFGVVAVCGTYYVQALTLTPLVLAASVPVGCLATAILVVNNVRDLDSDRRAGKYTLAVRLGPTGARLEYALLVGAAYAVLPVIVWLEGASAWALLPGVTLPWAVGLVRTVATRRAPLRLTAALAGTARLELAFAVCLAAGLAA